MKARISNKVKKLYAIKNNKKHITISKPAFIMIDKDEGFEITQNECVLRFFNSKVVVTLWKNIFMQHITIL